MTILDQLINSTSFSSYQDFVANYKVNPPENFHFAYDVVDAYAREQPQKRALLWLDDHGEEKEFSFGEIARLSTRLAGYLYDNGLRKGDRAMVILKRRWEYWITAVALHRIGAVLIPASNQLTAKDIIYRCNAADVKMIILLDDPFVKEQVTAALPECPGVKNIAIANGQQEGWLSLAKGMETGGDFPRPQGHSIRDPFLLYFTSGTTGMPKMVLHDHSYPLGHIVTAKFWQRVEDDGLHLTVSDSGWAKFGWGCIYGQWISGSAILGYDMESKFDPERLIQVIRHTRPTTVCVPATVYRFLMKAGLTREDFQSVRHCCTAGEPFSPEVSKEFTKLTGLTVHEGFGQSESSVLIGNYKWFDVRPGSMGKPSPLYNIRLLDEEGQPCPVGEEGEICVTNLRENIPYGLLRGYWADGRLAPCYDDIYHTGDIAWMDEDGYLWYVGRNDDVIKCSGYRIGPFEIETVLLTHPAVHECAITAAPDPLRGQIVRATIVLAGGYSPSPALVKEIQDYVKQMTAPYKYPRIVDFVDELPKTTSGKISRQQIRLKAEGK